jgi:hypothetical protein
MENYPTSGKTMDIRTLINFIHSHFHSLLPAQVVGSKRMGKVIRTTVFAAPGDLLDLERNMKKTACSMALAVIVAISFTSIKRKLVAQWA